MKVLPVWALLILARPSAWAVYLAARKERTAVIANLGALHPTTSRYWRWWSGYKVFLSFALTYLDRLLHMHFGKPIQWDVPHVERFDDMENEEGGVLVFTLHSGNYDIGAALFSEKFSRPINIVRLPERTESLAEIRSAELEGFQEANPRLRVHYNDSEWRLGADLLCRLQSGEVVAVQGDRVLGGISSVSVEYNGLHWRLPRGPLALAELGRVACYPVFLTRQGVCRYRIDVGHCFYDGKGGLGATEVAQKWLPIMHAFLLEHWDQWLAFETLLHPVEGKRP